jgi:hypothetical protein
MLLDTPRVVAENRFNGVLILAYGFSSDTVSRLILAGLATPVTETKSGARGLMITVEQIRITDDRRKALED